MTKIKAQIVATIGPASAKPDILRTMLEHGLSVIRMNFSFGTREERMEQISIIREIEKESGLRIPILADLPGPRIDNSVGHTYAPDIPVITEEDTGFIKFAAEQNLDYIGVSFVSTPEDIEKCRRLIKEFSGRQKIIAKIERAAALLRLEEIIRSSDAVMVARGDLGNEVPIEQIPFVQEKIVKMSKKLGKPVIVATEMMLSMVKNPVPTRAEVTDVAYAVLQGADAVMLSEETAIGKYPALSVMTVEKILAEVEKHTTENICSRL